MHRIRVTMFILSLTVVIVPNVQAIVPDAPSTNAVTPSSTTPIGYIKVSIITKSGVQDDSFNMTDLSNIQTVQQMLTGLSSASPPSWPQFGFRGYGLKNQGIDSLPSYVRVFQKVIEIFDTVGSNYYQDDHDLESFLSQQASLAMPQFSENRMLVKRDDPAPPKGLPTSGSEPPYEPDNWNKVPEIDDNNCYAYATNIMGNGFPNPGRAGGKEAPDPGQPGFNCANVVAAAEADGLIKADCDKVCPNCSFKVALVIWPDVDYHWYRQDDDGSWSHKPGADKATNKDDSGKPITDPRTADRGPYKTFCECFCVPPKKVKIRDVDSPVDICGGD